MIVGEGSPEHIATLEVKPHRPLPPRHPVAAQPAPRARGCDERSGAIRSVGSSVGSVVAGCDERSGDYSVGSLIGGVWWRVAMSEVALFGRFAHRWGVVSGCDERSGGIRSLRSVIRRARRSLSSRMSGGEFGDRLVELAASILCVGFTRVVMPSLSASRRRGRDVASEAPSRPFRDVPGMDDRPRSPSEVRRDREVES